MIGHGGDNCVVTVCCDCVLWLCYDCVLSVLMSHDGSLRSRSLHAGVSPGDRDEAAVRVGVRPGGHDVLLQRRVVEQVRVAVRTPRRRKP